MSNGRLAEQPPSTSDVESSVEFHRALAEHSTDCSAIAQRALGGILQMILNHFGSPSAWWLLGRSAIARRTLMGISSVEETIVSMVTEICHLQVPYNSEFSFIPLLKALLLYN